MHSAVAIALLAAGAANAMPHFSKRAMSGTSPSGPQTGSYEGSGSGYSAPVSQDVATACLQAHNDARALYGYPPLQWDDNLASSASGWSQHIQSNMMHSKAQGYGENLAWNTDANPRNMILSQWFDECPKYNGGYSDEAGHYTQCIWKSTTHVGCGINGDGMLCCEYFPQGNMVMPGQFEDNVPPPGQCHTAAGIPEGTPYTAPASGSSPSSGSGYTAPSSGTSPSSGSGYTAPSSGSGYTAPSSGSGYTAPSSGSGYTAPSSGTSPSSGYSGSSPSSGSSGQHGHGHGHGHPQPTQPEDDCEEEASSPAPAKNYGGQSASSGHGNHHPYGGQSSTPSTYGQGQSSTPSTYGQGQSGSHGSGSYGQGQSGSHGSGSYGQGQSGSHGSGSYGGMGQSGSHGSGSYGNGGQSGGHGGYGNGGQSGGHGGYGNGGQSGGEDDCEEEH